MQKQNSGNSKKAKLLKLLFIIFIAIIAVSCSNTQPHKDNKSSSNENKQQHVDEKSTTKRDEQTQPETKTIKSIFGTIKTLDKNTKVIGFDDLEVITADDKERMKEIGITDQDFSNWYLYNAVKEIKDYKIKDNTSIIIADKGSNNEISTDINGLYKQFLSGYENHYNIKVQGEYIVSIVQRIMNE